MKAEEKLRWILKRFRAQYHAITEPIINSILAFLDKGKRPYEAVTEALNAAGFSASIRNAVTDAAYKALCEAYGVLPKIAATVDGLKTKLLSESWTSDKMTLSKRLHGATIEMRRAIVDTISNAMAQAKTAKGIAMELYDGYNSGKRTVRQQDVPQYLQRLVSSARAACGGDPALMEGIEKAAERLKADVLTLKTPALKAAYSRLVEACKTFEEEAIDKAVHVALEEKSRYVAERIARTESARAWFDGYIAKRQDDPDIWGYKWVLSSRHYACPFCQCDVAANIDVGYGKGIYPKNKVPTIPRHPHCMCMLEEVFAWEKSGTKINPDLAKDYFDGLSFGEKARLFGIPGAEAYENGADWQSLLRGWDGFGTPESRFSAADFA